MKKIFLLLIAYLLCSCSPSEAQKQTEFAQIFTAISSPTPVATQSPLETLTVFTTAAPGTEEQKSGNNIEIAYIAEIDGVVDIFKANLNNSQVDNLTLDTAKEYCYSWSPDGNYIAYLVDDGTNLRQYPLYLVDLETGEKRKLTNEQKIMCNYSWSPDGTNIIGIDEENLIKIDIRNVEAIQEFYIQDARPMNKLKIPGCPKPCYWDDFEVYDIQRSQNGKKIALVIGSSTSREIYIFDLDNQKFKHIRYYIDIQTNALFEWGYRDEFIYYRATYGKRPNLYMININTKFTESITDYTIGLDYGDMTVSPDAEKIAYKFCWYYFYLCNGLIIETYENEEVAKIYGAVGEVSWSPNNNRIAYEKEGDIYVFNIVSKEETRVSSAGDEISSKIIWSSDGSEILFVRDGGIFIVDVDSLEEIKFINEKEGYYEPSFRPQHKEETS